MTGLLGSANSELGNIQLGFTGQVYSKTLNDTLTFSGTLGEVHVPGQISALGDTLTFSQSFSIQIVHQRSITQSLSFTDSLAYVSGAVHALAQSLSFSDSFVKSLAKSRSFNHSLSFSDSFSIVVTHLYREALNDLLGLSDSWSFLKQRPKTLTDSLVFTDSFTYLKKSGTNFSDRLQFISAFSIQRIIAPQFPSVTIPTPTIFDDDCCDPSINYFILSCSGNILYLPPPEFNNSTNPISNVDIKRAMSGTIRTYVKKTVWSTYKYHFLLSTTEARLLRLFIQRFASNLLTITDHTNTVRSGYLVNKPSFEQTIPWTEVDLEFKCQPHS